MNVMYERMMSRRRTDKHINHVGRKRCSVGVRKRWKMGFDDGRWRERPDEMSGNQNDNDRIVFLIRYALLNQLSSKKGD